MRLVPLTLLLFISQAHAVEESPDPSAQIVALVHGYEGAQRLDWTDLDAVIAAHPESSIIAAKELLEACRSDPQLSLTAIAHVIWRGGQPDGVILMLRCIQEHPDAKGKFTNELVALCHDLGSKRRRSEVTAAQIMGIMPELVACARQGDSTLRETCINSIGAFEDRSRDLKPSLPQVPPLRALPDYPKTGIFEALVAAAGDQIAQIRMAAISAMAKLGDPRADRVLLPFLSAGMDPSLRLGAIAALGQIGAVSALDQLKGLLHDPSEECRSAAAKALGQIGDRRAVGPLIDALSDNSPPVVLNAMYSLGSLGDARAAKSLVEKLKDPGVEVGHQAALALWQIKDKASVPALCELVASGTGELVKCNACLALGGAGDPAAIPTLLTALNHGSGSIPISAALALKEIGGKDAHAGLMSALGSADMSTVQAAIAVLVHDSTCTAQEREHMRTVIAASSMPDPVKQSLLLQALEAAPAPETVKDLYGAWTCVDANNKVRNMWIKSTLWVESDVGDGADKKGRWRISGKHLVFDDGVKPIEADIVHEGGGIQLLFSDGTRWRRATEEPGR